MEEEKLKEEVDPYETNIELMIKLKEKLIAFDGQVKGLTIGVVVLILIQFTMILWYFIR